MGWKVSFQHREGPWESSVLGGGGNGGRATGNGGNFKPPLKGLVLWLFIAWVPIAQPRLRNSRPTPAQGAGGWGSKPSDSARPRAPPLQKLPPAATQSIFSQAPPGHPPDPTLSFSPPAAWLRPAQITPLLTALPPPGSPGAPPRVPRAALGPQLHDAHRVGLPLAASTAGTRFGHPRPPGPMPPPAAASPHLDTRTPPPPRRGGAALLLVVIPRGPPKDPRAPNTGRRERNFSVSRPPLSRRI